MTSQVTKSDLGGLHDRTHAMTMTFRCPDDENRTPSRHPHPYRHTVSPSPRHWRPTPTFILLPLAVVVVVVGLAGPVHAGLMDFSAPDVIQYGTCAQPKEQQPFDFRQVSAYLWRGGLNEGDGRGKGA